MLNSYTPDFAPTRIPRQSSAISVITSFGFLVPAFGFHAAARGEIVP
jgi:hypothetical protein